jgi:hypothetical protein
VAPPRLRRTSLFTCNLTSTLSKLPQTFHTTLHCTTTTSIMASAAKKKLVVCGGNGFLGTHS